jgi:hypothetical protein
MVVFYSFGCYWSNNTEGVFWIFPHPSHDYPSARVLTRISDYIFTMEDASVIPVEKSGQSVEELLAAIASTGVVFLRSVIGLVVRPYEAMRTIILRKHLHETVYVLLCICAYLGLSSVVKINAFRPYLLTRQFVLLFSGFTWGYACMALTLLLAGRIYAQKIAWQSVIVGWGYTLIPTVLWFLSTSLLYVVLPPPRTVRIEGIAFSVLYLVFSTVLLFWKLQLVYLCIRFALKLDVLRISTTIAMLLFVGFLYSYVMYRCGIFRIPFI